MYIIISAYWTQHVCTYTCIYRVYTISAMYQSCHLIAKSTLSQNFRKMYLQIYGNPNVTKFKLKGTKVQSCIWKGAKGQTCKLKGAKVQSYIWQGAKGQIYKFKELVYQLILYCTFDFVLYNNSLMCHPQLLSFQV